MRQRPPKVDAWLKTVLKQRADAGDARSAAPLPSSSSNFRSRRFGQLAGTLERRPLRHAGGFPLRPVLPARQRLCDRGGLGWRSLEQHRASNRAKHGRAMRVRRPPRSSERHRADGGGSEGEHVASHGVIIAPDRRLAYGAAALHPRRGHGQVSRLLRRVHYRRHAEHDRVGCQAPSQHASGDRRRHRGSAHHPPPIAQNRRNHGDTGRGQGDRDAAVGEAGTDRVHAHNLFDAITAGECQVAVSPDTGVYDAYARLVPPRRQSFDRVTYEPDAKPQSKLAPRLIVL